MEMENPVKLLAPVISPPPKHQLGSRVASSLHFADDAKPKRKKQKLGAPKNLWSPREDRILGSEVLKLGEKAWSEIAAKLPGRVGKQCRDRWRNHLCPEVKKGSWTTEEDELLFEYREKLGNQWAEIAKHIPGRTDLSVKNRFYSYCRKLQRQKKRQAKVSSELSRPRKANAVVDKNQMSVLFKQKQPFSDLSNADSKQHSAQLKPGESREARTPSISKSDTSTSSGSSNPKSPLSGVPLPFGSPLGAGSEFPLLLQSNLVNNMNLQLALFNLNNATSSLNANEANLLLALSNNLSALGTGANLNFRSNNEFEQREPTQNTSPTQTSTLNLLNRANISNLRVDTNVGLNPAFLTSPSPNPNVNLSKTLYNTSPLCSTPLAQIKKPYPCRKTT